ncbi:hypothetical protein L227DRAFT_580101 [Lentinus tigrinus ALCF2SS1-6]|uniref:Uncharacterized protein n=1 Tax=Lentinus tigrinus ALCF2SS1-6 TaxID=1328759 RepID=A0A5C2RUN1_9APHY|nr:hypothetical protein L227DRAFT_580101 [Lentinus tigrinus ALCF2SS1-6]
MPVYALAPGEQSQEAGDSPRQPKKFYSSTVFSAVPRSLRKLTLLLDVDTVVSLPAAARTRA